jgi:hypothetical protein
VDVVGDALLGFVDFEDVRQDRIQVLSAPIWWKFESTRIDKIKVLYGSLHLLLLTLEDLVVFSKVSLTSSMIADRPGMPVSHLS